MKKYLYILTIVLFASCAITTHYVQSGSQAYTKTSKDVVKVYSGVPDKEFIVIGSVAADAPGDQNSALDELKEEASKIGADAVINVKFSTLTTFSNRTGLTGTAVKFK